MTNLITDPMLAAYALAAAGITIYVFFLWLQMRGWWTPSARWKNFIRLCCICLLLAPFAVRYQYSQATILYLSVAMVTVGGLIKFLRGKGV